MRSQTTSKYARAVLCLASVVACAHAMALDYSNGFETDIAGWDVFGGSLNAVRVPSGTNGIASASGAFHAEVDAGATHWGGYGGNAGCASTACAAAAFPANGYVTAVDIYLDVDAGLANDTRFDFTSAISTPAGAHRRDFAFNAGFYNDATGPGAGVNRFVVSASNNTGRSNSFPKNPGRNPVAIDVTGWYTFQHTFYDNGSGVLAVDLQILNDQEAVVGSWTLSDASDLLNVTVGSNRYGWFASNELPVLAIDNSEKYEIVLDADGDGIPDDQDDCPASDLSATVIIDGCDTGVANTVFPDGCSIADVIAEIAADARNHGAFVSAVAQFSNSLKSQGLISGKEKGAIQKCAARADIP